MISHIRGYIMNEENTGHSVTVNQVIIATVMTSTLPSGTINFVVLLLIEPLYEDNIDRNSEISYQLRYLQCIFHRPVLLECCYLYKWQYWNYLSRSKTSFSHGPCRQFLCVVKLRISSNCIHMQLNLSYVTFLWNIEKSHITQVVAKYRFI